MVALRISVDAYLCWRLSADCFPFLFPPLPRPPLLLQVVDTPSRDATGTGQQQGATAPTPATQGSVPAAPIITTPFWRWNKPACDAPFLAKLQRSLIDAKYYTKVGRSTHKMICVAWKCAGEDGGCLLPILVG